MPSHASSLPVPPASHLEFSSLTISFLIHATEDEARLVGAVLSSFSVLEEDLTRETLEGHYGNRIISVKAHVIGGRATEISTGILLGLCQESKVRLLAEFESHLDEHDALYIRLDRQALPSRFLLGEDDPVSIKIKPKFRFKDRGKMTNAYKELIRH